MRKVGVETWPDMTSLCHCLRLRLYHQHQQGCLSVFEVVDTFIVPRTTVDGNAAFWCEHPIAFMLQSQTMDPIDPTDPVISFPLVGN